MSMKTNKILLYTLLALPALLMQSCLKDQEDIFDKPASQRMSEYLQGAQEALVSAPYGWSFDYYPEGNQSYGGFTYTIGFSNDADTVRFENNPDDGQLVSLYKMKTDDGPVLSFDTYNSFLHKYATPTDGKYQAEKGDFEFVIDSVGSDIIKVHGKKTGNTLYLRKLTEPAAQYMQKVVDMGDSFFPSEADLTIGGKPYQLVFTDLTNRQADIYDNGTYLTTPAYNFTDKGLRLYQPLSLNGVTVQDIAYDDDKLTLTADGVETSKFLISPYVVAQMIGNIGAPAVGTTKTFNVSHLDQLDITTTASWVHITKNGNKLTIKVDANPDKSKARITTVKIVNKNSSDLVTSITVSQFELDALLGDWNLSMLAYDASNGAIGKVKVNASLNYDTNANGEQQLYLTVNASSGTYSIPAIYLKAYNALLLQSNQLVGTYGNYYLGNFFLFGGGNYWTAGQPNFYDMVTFNVDEAGNITTTLNGELLLNSSNGLEDVGEAVEEIFIGAFSSSDLTSDSYAGWFDRWSKTSMVKVASSSPSKPAVIGGDFEKGPVYLKGIKPRYNSHPNLSGYNLFAPKTHKHIK